MFTLTLIEEKKLIFPREGAIRSEMRSSGKDSVIFDMKLDL